jgi:uncharacterized protein (DUF1501 family)
VTALDVARRYLRRVAEDLETLQLTLGGIQANLPESPAESDRLLDVEAMDATMELRAVISCVLNDYIGPAARDLRGALAVTRKEKAREPAS